MKKIVLILGSLLLLIAACAYAILFTPPGNTLLKGVVEKRLDEQIEGEAKLTLFRLTPVSFAMEIVIDEDSRIKLDGTMNLLSRFVDASYEVDIKDLSKLRHYTQIPLAGGFRTNGKASGNAGLITIAGQSDAFGSESSYDVVLANFAPQSLKASVKGARVEEILFMLGQSAFGKGVINVNLDIDMAELKRLSETLQAIAPEEKKPALKTNRSAQENKKERLQWDYLNADINATLRDKKLSASVEVDSDMIRLSSKKISIDLESKKIDAHYWLDIPNLQKLEFATGRRFNGALKTSGKIGGTLDAIKIEGVTDLFEGQSSYALDLLHFSPTALVVNVKGAKIDKFLYAASWPVYATGLIDIDAAIDRIDLGAMEFYGKVNAAVAKGIINGKVVNKEFNTTLPNSLAFKADLKTTLKKNQAVAVSTISSEVADLTAQKTIIDLKKKSFQSDYKLTIPDLDKLYFQTKTHMSGSLVVTGDASYDKKLKVTGQSKTLGGAANFKLDGDNLTATMKDIKSVEVTQMLGYPKIFSSFGNADLVYNLATQKGSFNADMHEGRILPNQMSLLLNTMAKFDITKEIYEITKVEGTIDKKIVVGDLYMKSRLTEIKSDDAKIDMQKEQVDAKLSIAIKGKNAYVKVKGAVKSPHVSLDVSELIKGEVKEKAKEKIEKEIEKKIPRQFEEPLKQLFKGL